MPLIIFPFVLVRSERPVRWAAPEKNLAPFMAVASSANGFVWVFAFEYAAAFFLMKMMKSSVLGDLMNSPKSSLANAEIVRLAYG